MNDENLKKWIEELRTTDKHQANGAMYDGYGYCCLGVAQELAFGVRTPQGQLLPGNELVEWLGLDTGEEHGNYWDLEIDWPYPVDPDEPMTAAHCNDMLRMTFEQIADTIEYFGIKRARWVEF